MSHFYSRIQGHRGEATRCGTKSSGIRAEATGWNIGTVSSLRYDETLDTDVVQVYLTTGSNGRSQQLFAEFYRDGDSFKCLRTDFPELLI